MKNILLVGTGGTIASSISQNGLTPKINADDLLKFLPNLDDECKVTTISLMSIDSSNMNPKLIGEIASTIYKYYDMYDGFVVTHGTDTLAYTSSALTYMLMQIQKPIVITGAQSTIEYKYTDAKQNIADSITFALEDISGVFVVFDSKVILGTRAMKYKTRSSDAFYSFNFPDIAKIKYGKVMYNKEIYYGKYKEVLNYNKDLKPVLKNNLCNDIMVIKIFPGIKPNIFDFVKENYKGVIIESFGIGGIPNKDYDIVSKIKELVDSRIQVVITTQCLEEGIDLDIYEVGKILARHNVIYSHDMNTEAIVMKLMWAIENLESSEEIKRFIEKPILGDTTKHTM